MKEAKELIEREAYDICFLDMYLGDQIIGELSFDPATESACDQGG